MAGAGERDAQAEIAGGAGREHPGFEHAAIRPGRRRQFPAHFPRAGQIVGCQRTLFGVLSRCALEAGDCGFEQWECGVCLSACHHGAGEAGTNKIAAAAFRTRSYAGVERGEILQGFRMVSGVQRGLGRFKRLLKGSGLRAASQPGSQAGGENGICAHHQFPFNSLSIPFSTRARG